MDGQASAPSPNPYSYLSDPEVQPYDLSRPWTRRISLTWVKRILYSPHPALLLPPATTFISRPQGQSDHPGPPDQGHWRYVACASDGLLNCPTKRLRRSLYDMTNLTRTTNPIPSIFTSPSILLLAILTLFSNLRCALATDVVIDSTPREDHNHHRLQPPVNDMDLENQGHVGTSEQLEDEQIFVQYEALFPGEDPGILGRRQLSPDHTELKNNVGMQSAILPGESLLFQVQNSTIFGNKSPTTPGLPSVPFPKVELSGSDDNPSDDDLDTFFKRQDTDNGVTVFITINTCNQPIPKKTRPSSFPQLTMYVSHVTPVPGPKANAEDQTEIDLVQGYGNISLTVTSDVYVAVYPPEFTDFTGQWFFEIAASVDAPYHQWNNWDPTPRSKTPWNPLLFVDSDTTSALLITQNFTSMDTSEEVNQQWLKSENPFALFAFPDATSIEGLTHSFCGINTAAQQLGKAPGNTTVSVTSRGNGGLPKGQFYMQNLDGGSNYTVMMAMQGNSTMGGPNVVGGGGQIWQDLTFPTKSSELPHFSLRPFIPLIFAIRQ